MIKPRKIRDELATDLKPTPGDFHLGSLQSRAMARALVQSRHEDKQTILLTNYSWEPGHSPELTNSFSDGEGKVWEVWSVPQGYTGDLP